MYKKFNKYDKIYINKFNVQIKKYGYGNIRSYYINNKTKL